MLLFSDLCAEGTPWKFTFPTLWRHKPGKKQKVLEEVCIPNYKKRWPAVKDDIDKLEDISKSNCKSRQTGSQLIAKEALDFGKHALALGVFCRGDYRKLCELFVYFLGGDVPGFKFHQPGA